MFDNVHLYRIDDRGQQRGCMWVQNATEAKRWNEDRWGIFFTPNTFRVPTQDEHKQHGTSLPRNARYLQRINFAFADLDVAKAEDNVPLDQVAQKKQRVYESLVQYALPSYLIETRNGWQPLWRLDLEPTPENREQVVNVINGIIHWSRSHGAYGDEVKDTERLLRMPGYYHHKREPFLVSCTPGDDRVWTLDELQKLFPFQAKKYEPTAEPDVPSILDRVALEDILRKAFAVMGRTFELDKDGHRVMLDGRVTGNFIDRRTGRKEFLATSSGTEPYKGNKITAVASILGCNNREAVEWITREFDLKPIKTNTKPIADLKPLADSINETWTYLRSIKPDTILQFGIPYLDERLGGFFEGEVWLLGGETGSGKTSLAAAMLRANEKRAKVAHIILEDTQREYDLPVLYYAINKVRKQRGKPSLPWAAYRTNAVRDPQYEDEAAEARHVLSQSSVLLFRQKTTDLMNIAQLQELFRRESENGVRMFCIDHLHFFEHEGERGEQQTHRIERTVRAIKRIADKFNVAVMILAHYRKLNGEKPSLDSFKDSGSFAQIASGVINLWRDRSEFGLAATALSGRSETEFHLPKIRAAVPEMSFRMEFDRTIGEFDFSTALELKASAQLIEGERKKRSDKAKPFA